MSSVFLLSSSFADIHEAVGSQSLLNHSGYQQPDLVVELHLCSLVSILQKHEFEKNTRLFNGAAATYPDTVLVSRVDYAIKVRLLCKGLYQEYWVDKASNGNNFLVLARDLSVTWGEDSRYWHWPYIKETRDAVCDSQDARRYKSTTRKD
ncbi:hypothetical protein Tco_1425460 [Tanacetum coccineum]